MVALSETFSATDISRLKSEIWCLQNSLTDSTTANANMQLMVQKTVEEKYDVLHELQVVVRQNEILESHLIEERDLYAHEKRKLLAEIHELREKLKIAVSVKTLQSSPF